MISFKPRFALSEIPNWSSRYAYDGTDTYIESNGPRTAELVEVCDAFGGRPAA